MIGDAPVFSAGGTVASSATPSNAAPGIGDSIVVTIAIDVSGVAAPDNKLGNFTGTLDWNSAVLAYHTDSGILAGFTGLILIYGVSKAALTTGKEAAPGLGNTESIARALFTDYLLPFEVTSILLLVAIVGAVVVAKERI